jgi:hypothetical protein
MNEIIKKFNDISIDFLAQTSKIVGMKYLLKFKFVTKINSVYAIDIFIRRILPHKDQIHTRDEQFFLEKADDNEFNEYMNDITGIKTIYHTLDDKSKENIWEILLALVYLAEERQKYINNKSKAYN